MELPPCPACGAELAQDSPRGRARCPECGFSTPMELDVAALQRLLLEASPSARELGAALATRSPAADAARQGARPVAAPQGPRAGAPPPPAPMPPAPPRPAGIDARAPPPLADLRAPMAPPLAPPSTQMRDAMAEADARRRREMSARGELLR